MGAAAPAVVGLQNHDLLSRRDQRARRRQSGRPGSEDDRVEIALKL
jgi:hypothetical protein